MRLIRLIIFLAIFLGIGYGVWVGVFASGCEDSDQDDLSDCEEISLYHTEPYAFDTDGDGYGDGEEVKNGYSPHFGNGIKLKDIDTDNDGLSDLDEFKKRTNILRSDSDGDGVSDYDENLNGSDPNDSSSQKSIIGFVKQKLMAEY